MNRIALLVSVGLTFSLSLTFIPATLAQEPPTDEPAPKAAPPDEAAAPAKKRTPAPRNPNRGPWDNDLVIAESSDGITFSKPTTFVERGGVPSIVSDSGGKLIAAFQWFPMDEANIAHFDQVAIVTSTDNGKTWSEPTPVTVAGIGKDYIRPCDPTLAVLDDGRIRMYFTSHEPGVRNAATYSAISSDGVNFTFEPGVRFRVDGRQVLDCSVARLNGTWHYFAPLAQGAGKAYHATSDDGLVFKRGEDLSHPNGLKWLGCAVSDGEQLRFFGTASAGVWTARSTDGVNWQLDPVPPRKAKEPKPAKEGEEPRAEAERKPKPENPIQIRMRGADPGVVKTADGRWLLIATGPPRDDAGQHAPPANRPLIKPAPKPKAEGAKKNADGEKKPD